MKKLILILIIFTNISLSHRQSTHQYIVREAYKLLKLHFGVDIPRMKDHVGSVEGYAGNGSWTTGLIHSGAWLEDDEDVVYRYSKSSPPTLTGITGSIYTFISLFGGATPDGFVSSTHFWYADDGDDLMTTLRASCYILGSENVVEFTIPNAYQKIMKYANGNWILAYSPPGRTLRVQKPNGEWLRLEANINDWVAFSYSGIANLYKNKRMQTELIGTYSMYNETLGRYEWYNGNVIISDELRDLFVWEILGRMCHLLEDMSVPSHVNNDPHGDNSGLKPDSYENYFGYNYGWNADNVYSQFGGFIDPYISSNPVHYLMYTTNQMSNHFASEGPHWKQNNDVLGGNPASEELAYLNSKNISSFGQPTTINGPFDEQNILNMRDKLFPQAIRTTAGLLYWFAKESGLLSIITVPGNYSSVEQALNGATSGQTIIVTSGNYTISSNLTVPAGVTMQVEPGVSLTFNNVSFNVSGTLNASGTTFTFNNSSLNIENVSNLSESNFVFNNSTFFVIGGTLIAERSTFQSNGIMGSWQGINVFGSTNSNFQNCEIKDATYGVNIYSGYVAVRNCRITNCNYGVYNTYYSSSDIGPSGVFSGNNWDVRGDYTSVPSSGGSYYGYISFRDPGYYQVYSDYPGTINACGNFWYACNYPPIVTQNVYTYNQLCSDPNPLMAPKSPYSEEGTIMLSKKQDGTPLQINKVKEPGMDEVDIANQLFFKGQYSEALPKYQNLVDKYPDNFAGEISLVFMERCLDKLDRKTEISDLLNFISLNNTGKKISKAVDLRKVYQYLRNGDIKNAISQAKDVLKYDDDTTHNKMVLFDLGNIYWNNLNDKTTGETYFRQLIKKYPYDILSEMALVTLGEWKPKKKENKNISVANINNTELISNYPNPFNPSTTITYAIPKDGQVKLVVYDILGKEVKTLVNEVKPIGSYSVQFDANKLSSGNYYCRIFITPSNGEKMIVQQKQMQVLK